MKTKSKKKMLTLIDLESFAQHKQLWQVDNVQTSLEIHFTLKCTKRLISTPNLLASWELVTKGFLGRPVKCVHFEKTLTFQGMVYIW